MNYVGSIGCPCCGCNCAGGLCSQGVTTNNTATNANIPLDAFGYHATNYWLDEADEFEAWVASLKPLPVAGPLPPWRTPLQPRMEARAPRGHPNPHRARWA